MDVGDALPWVARKLASSLKRRPQTEAGDRSELKPPVQTPVEARQAQGPASLSRTLANNIFPVRHGEFGNSVTELYYFSRPRWSRLFQQAGWRIDTYATNQMAYTGHGLIGLGLGLAARRRLARVLGSSCHVFVLRKA